MLNQQGREKTNCKSGKKNGGGSERVSERAARHMTSWRSRSKAGHLTDWKCTLLPESDSQKSRQCV